MTDRPRIIHCTGGRRHFGILPNGATYRCVNSAISANNKWALIGNILCGRTRESVKSNVDEPWPCQNAKCSENCSAQFTERHLSDGRILALPWIAKMAGKNYASVHYEMTNRCQFQCDYCVIQEWKRRYKGRIMSRNECLSFAQWFLETFETGDFNLVGGEPTMHDGFADMVASICNAGWSCLVKTNLFNGAPLLAAAMQIEDSKKKNLGIEWSLHAHQPGFSWENALLFLRSYREIVPLAYTAAVMIDYGPNHEKMGKAWPDVLGQLGVKFRVVPNIRARSVAPRR